MGIGTGFERAAKGDSLCHKTAIQLINNHMLA